MTTADALKQTTADAAVDKAVSLNSQKLVGLSKGDEEKVRHAIRKFALDRCEDSVKCTPLILKSI